MCGVCVFGCVQAKFEQLYVISLWRRNHYLGKILLLQFLTSTPDFLGKEGNIFPFWKLMWFPLGTSSQLFYFWRTIELTFEDVRNRANVYRSHVCINELNSWYLPRPGSCISCFMSNFKNCFRKTKKRLFHFIFMNFQDVEFFRFRVMVQHPRMTSHVTMFFLETEKSFD